MSVSTESMFAGSELLVNPVDEIKNSGTLDGVPLEARVIEELFPFKKEWLLSVTRHSLAEVYVRSPDLAKAIVEKI